jgi:outer membrane lipoprotein-sorting protein
MEKKVMIGILALLGILLLVFVSGCETSTFTLRDAAMAKGMSEDGYPIDIATTFSTTEPEIFAWFSYAHAPPGTRVKTVWIYTPSGETITTSEETLEEIDGKIGFYLTKPEKGWVVGDHRVDFYVEEEFVKSLSFSIE